VRDPSGGLAATVPQADDSERTPAYRAGTTLSFHKGDSMKRVTTLVAVLLSLTAASAAIAAGGPGKFQTRLAGKGAKTENGRLDGTWVLDLASAPSGTIKLTWNGESLGGGKYVISSSVITFTSKRGGQCVTKGKYRFKLRHKTLRFTAISDACMTRRDVLTYGPWTMVR
jgi:hypothetical protein